MTSRALVFAKKPVGAVMMRSLVEALQRSGKLRFYGCSRLFGRSDAGAIFAQAGLRDLAPISRLRARLAAFDLYLSADFSIAAPRARCKVHTFHGVSFRNHAVNTAALRYDLLLVAGSYMRRRFEELGIVTAANSERFPVVGMPKLDALVDGSLRRDEVLARLELDPARRTVLYAPTWSKKFSSLEVFGDAMLRALRDLPFNVIVKLHDNTLDRRKASRDWRAALVAMQSERLRYVAEPDVVPLMVAADAAISDASSVANEYTLLDRPLVFVATPGLRDKVKSKADLDTWGQKAGVVVDEPSRLGAALDAEFADPSRLSAIRRALAEDLFFQPGGATANAVAAIERALATR
jgi:CDP-Glycerol:Poly(glycerophosphate) glycerophosphotransferase